MRDGRDVIPKSIQLAAGRTAQEYNQRKRRNGAYWEDRYHATAVQTDLHLIQCIVYMDLNMVRAVVDKHPYEWPKRCIYMKAKVFDEKFDAGDDILDVLDLTKAKRTMQDQKRVNVDFPAWMIESLDKEASRVGVTRQSIIKVWLAERLENLAANKARTSR